MTQIIYIPDATIFSQFTANVDFSSIYCTFSHIKNVKVFHTRCNDLITLCLKNGIISDGIFISPETLTENHFTILD